MYICLGLFKIFTTFYSEIVKGNFGVDMGTNIKVDLTELCYGDVD